MEHLTSFAASGYSIDELQLFSDVDKPVVIALLADCAVVRVAAKQTVIDTNSKGSRLYVLLSGALTTTHHDKQDGAQDATIAQILPGECVGELSVLDDEAHSTTIYALQDSNLLVIEAGKLWKLIDESNGVARNLLRLLSFRVRAATAQIRRRNKVGEFYRQMSMIDGLTGLQNRAWLNDHFPKLIQQAHETENPLSVIMIDIDHFKKFNDEYGHQAGDDALQVAARALTETLRPRDFAARYGGEELIVILTNTHKKTGAIVAERLCARLQQSIVFPDMRIPLPHVTASFGVASLAAGQDAHALIAVADAALYRAKEAGRNRVALQTT